MPCPILCNSRRLLLLSSRSPESSLASPVYVHEQPDEALCLAKIANKITSTSVGPKLVTSVLIRVRGPDDGRPASSADAVHVLRGGCVERQPDLELGGPRLHALLPQDDPGLVRKQYILISPKFKDTHPMYIQIAFEIC